MVGNAVRAQAHKKGNCLAVILLVVVYHSLPNNKLKWILQRLDACTMADQQVEVGRMHHLHQVDARQRATVLPDPGRLDFVRAVMHCHLIEWGWIANVALETCAVLRVATVRWFWDRRYVGLSVHTGWSMLLVVEVVFWQRARFHVPTWAGVRDKKALVHCQVGVQWREAHWGYWVAPNVACLWQKKLDRFLFSCVLERCCELLFMRFVQSGLIVFYLHVQVLRLNVETPDVPIVGVRLWLGSKKKYHKNYKYMMTVIKFNHNLNSPACFGWD